MKKPNKIIYKNQKKIHDRVVKFINSKLTKDVKEAYLIGSITKGEFGKYTKKYEGREGSDIDLVVMPEDKIPSDWKYLNTEKIWWKLYQAGHIEINGIQHRLDIMVVKEGKEDYLEKRAKELNWKVEKIK